MSKINIPSPCHVHFGHVQYPPGGTCGPRIQTGLQFVVLDQGEMRVVTDGKVVDVAPREMVCQWPGGHEHYLFSKTQITTHRWVSIHFDRLADNEHLLESLRHRSRQKMFETSAMREIYDLGYRHRNTRNPRTIEMLSYLALAYGSGYLMPTSEEALGKTAPLPSPLLSMRRLLTSRYDEKLTLQDLAQAARVTPNHLTRLCKQHFSMTPMKMLQETRLVIAGEMLRDTGLSVAEIAYETGFVSPFHFSRLVKDRYGLSPKQYRQQAWAARSD